MRRSLVALVAVAFVLGTAAGAIAMRVSHRATYVIDSQGFADTVAPFTTHATGFQDVPGLESFQICPDVLFTADVSLVMKGAPAEIRVADLHVDTTKYLQPGVIAIPASSKPRPVAMTFAQPDIEAGAHQLTVQVRSKTGSDVTVVKGLIRALLHDAQSCF